MIRMTLAASAIALALASPYTAFGQEGWPGGQNGGYGPPGGQAPGAGPWYGQGGPQQGPGPQNQGPWYGQTGPQDGPPPQSGNGGYPPDGGQGYGGDPSGYGGQPGDQQAQYGGQSGQDQSHHGSDKGVAVAAAIVGLLALGAALSSHSDTFTHDGRTYTHVHQGPYQWPDPQWQGHAFAPGDMLPPSLYVASYLISQPQTIGLYAPPPNDQWIRVGSDAILVDSGSGSILNVIPGLFS